MSTRSNIGIINDDGTVTTTYCHWDGYLQGNGSTLLKHYTTEEKIRALLALGSLSSLGAELGDKHDFYASTQSDTCTAYHRDRGDDWETVKPHTHEDLDAAVEAMEEYLYVWMHDRWVVSEGGEPLKDLTEELIASEGEEEAQ